MSEAEYDGSMDNPFQSSPNNNNMNVPLLKIWVNYNELTTSSLEIIVSKGNHPQMALIQVSELF